MNKNDGYRIIGFRSVKKGDIYFNRILQGATEAENDIDTPHLILVWDGGNRFDRKEK